MRDRIVYFNEQVIRIVTWQQIIVFQKSTPKNIDNDELFIFIGHNNTS